MRTIATVAIRYTGGLSAMMRAAVERRGFGDADRVAALLHHRLRLASKRPVVDRGRYIARPMPAATGPMSLDDTTTDRSDPPQYAEPLTQISRQPGSGLGTCLV